MPRFIEAVGFDKEARGVVFDLANTVASSAVKAKGHTADLYNNATTGIATSIFHHVSQLRNTSVVSATAAIAAPYYNSVVSPLHHVNSVSVWLFSSGILVMLLRAVTIEIKATRLMRSHGHATRQ